MAEKEGHYEKHGDIEEWVWDDEGPGVPTLTGGWVVPEGEFDPTSAPSDVKSASEKVAEKGPSGGLKVAEEPEEVEEEDDLDTYTKEELQDMLADRGLPTSGNKPDLIERLRA